MQEPSQGQEYNQDQGYNQEYNQDQDYNQEYNQDQDYYQEQDQDQDQEPYENFSIKNDSLNNSKSSQSQEKINDYLIKETIGSGTFAKVKLCLHIPTNETYAIKILTKSKIPDQDFIFIKRELDLLKKFSHPNIIKLIEILENEEKFFIVTEYCENGELYNIIVNNQRLSNEVSALFYYQLINGLEFIHNKNIVHRDIKPENLLISQNKFLKIIDFGLSNYLPEDGLLETPCGSPCYASPEMVSGCKYGGIKHDIWSSGVVLYAMLCGYLPFEEDHNDLLFKKIQECELEYPDFLTEDAKMLIMKILVPDCDERLSISQIKEEPFYLLGKQIYEEIENKEEGISLLCNNNNDDNDNNANDNDFIPMPLPLPLPLPKTDNDNEEQPFICEEIQLPNDNYNNNGLRDTILPGQNIREVNVNMNLNINNLSNNIKPKPSKPKTTPSKTTNTTTSNKPYRKITNTSSSKTPQEPETTKRYNNSSKKPKHIYIDEQFNKYIPNPSLRKNKNLISNNIPKRTETSHRCNTQQKRKEKKYHRSTGYANNQKVMFQNQQKPKTASDVKIITQKSISISKSRNNSSTKVKRKSFKPNRNNIPLNYYIPKTSNMIQKTPNQSKLPPSTTLSPCTKNYLFINAMPLQTKQSTYANSKERKGNSVNKRKISPCMVQKDKKGNARKMRSKEYIGQFLTKKGNDANYQVLNSNGNKKRELMLDINLNSQNKTKMLSSKKNCSLKKGNKKKDYNLEFGGIRMATNHTESSIGRKHCNHVTTQENYPINSYWNQRNGNYKDTYANSQSGNLSNYLKYNNTNKNTKTANITVTTNKKPSSMRTHAQSSCKSRKGLISSLRYKNSSGRTCTSHIHN